MASSASATLDLIFKGQDQVSSVMKDINTSTGNLGETFEKVGLAITAAAAAATAAVVAFGAESVLQFSNIGDEVEKMSERTGLAAESVSALRVAAQASGTSIETVEQGIKKMQLTMKDAGSASDGLKDAFKGIGMTIDDIFAKGTTPEIQFELLADAIGNVKDPSQRAQLAFEAFGKAGTDLIPLFEQGNFSMKEWSDQAKALGVSFDEVSAKNAAQLNDAIGALKTAFQGLTLTIGGELAPIVTKIINESLIPLAEKIIAMIPTIEQVTSWIGQARDAFMRAGQQFEEHTGILSQLRTSFQEVWSVVETELWPAIQRLIEASKPLQPLYEALGKLLAGAFILALKLIIEALTLAVIILTKMATAAADVATAFLTVAKPAIETITTVFNNVSGVVQTVVNQFNSLKAAALGALDAIRSALNAVPQTVSSGFQAVANALPHFASGGLVRATPGGVPVLVGEGGEDEIIAPLSSLGSLAGPSGGIVINITGNSFVGKEDIAEQIGNEIISTLKQVLKF